MEPEHDTQQQQPSPQAAPILTARPENKKKKRIIIGAASLLILIIISVVVYFVFLKSDNKSQQSQTSSPATQTAAQSTLDVSAELARFIKPTTGETWLSIPKEVAKQGWYRPDANIEQDATYYEIGKHGNNTIYMGAYNAIGDTIDLFEKAPDGTVSYIARADNQATYNETEEARVEAGLRDYTFIPTIKFDKTTSYDSLSIPKELQIDNGYKLSRSTYSSIGERLSNEKDLSADQKPDRKIVKELGGSKVFKIEKTYTDTKLTSIGYGIITPIQNIAALTYEPINTDSTTYQWTSGDSSSTGKYYPITRGCGGIKTSVTRGDTITEADVVQTGKTKDGQAIYEFKDPNYITVNKAYDEWKEYAGTEKTIPYYNISKADYLKRHALVVHKDKFNQWLIFINEELAPAAGCAKPVVYLYPTQTTKVNVKVSADVKISDPLYNPATGWNAIAQPNGQLTVNGAPYDSLFWEGPGSGEYPAITSGTVVPHDTVITTIRSQLSAQGLNDKESADFITYWQDKIPNKPYVRLTWLNTAQLNQLAPLTINPKPDTTIRVFLDMSGLDQPISIKPQTFSAPKRTGFTVVEWGGLANFKLY